MASNKYRYPPAPPNARGTFSDKLVGLQFHDGGELTQSNFEFTTKVVERVGRKFNTGVFSSPISLSDINIKDVNSAIEVFNREFTAKPNFDTSNVLSFSLYGSTQKRISTSITKIIGFFPASIEVDKDYYNYSTGYTAYDIVYDSVDNTTTFKIDVSRIKNPFDIDFTSNASLNEQNREIEVSYLRNLTKNYSKYSLYINNLNDEFEILDLTPSNTLNSGFIEIEVDGNPFNNSQTTESLTIKPNSEVTEEVLKRDFDEIEDFLLNRGKKPLYTAIFQVVLEGDNGKLYKTNKKVTWPIDGQWNLDIRTDRFEDYLNKLNRITFDLDEFRTNLISRFLTAGTLKDFDTKEQKFEKVLQIYGRNFDEIKKYIDALSHINSVNYRVKDDIPSELLKDLANTVGWSNNISPINNSDLLGTIYSSNSESSFSGKSKKETANEISYQYYRNLILNTAYLFKSKGTLRAIESLLNIAGIPKSLVEMSESVYLVDNPVNIDTFNTNFESINEGTVLFNDVILDGNSSVSVLGIPYTAYQSINRYEITTNTREDYPVGDDGYPKAPRHTEDMFYQKGAGWYKSTPQHRSNEIVNTTNLVFTGQNENIQTELEPFTYGEKYLNIYKKFPNMRMGFNLLRVDDNKKSWVDTKNQSRKNNNANLNSNYTIRDERLVLNSKKIDLALNVGRGIVYDIWQLSRQYEHPITNEGLITGYPNEGGIDWTVINPKPKEKTFFEFNKTFFKNMINVRNRQFITDGKGGGYPTLQKLHWDYLKDKNSNKFTYQKTIDYTNGIGDYWMRLVEQMVPATTLWHGGQKFENSVLHRQKFPWKVNRTDHGPDEGCDVCIFEGPIYSYGCNNYQLNCDITLTNGQSLLSASISAILGNRGYNVNDCDNQTIISTWKAVIKYNTNIVYESPIGFYNGSGPNDYPSQQQWIDEILIGLQNLQQYNLSYDLIGNNLIISNLDCNEDLSTSVFTVEVKINTQIECD